jgi:hypothetical protein
LQVVSGELGLDPFDHEWVLTQTLVDTAPEQWGGLTITPR